MLSPITLKFLEAVKINNNTEWMHKNRDLYLQEKDRFLGIIEELLKRMQEVDPTLAEIKAKDCMYRFNKDIRFSKDKSPYKTHFGAFLCEGGRKSPLPGYYLHIEPGNKSGISGGSRCPSPQQQRDIKYYILKHFDEWEEITQNSDFCSYFGEIIEKDDVDLERRIKGKRAKGLFERLGKTRTTKLLETPEMKDLLLYNKWCVWHPVKDKNILSNNFVDQVMEGFLRMKAFNEFIGKGF